MMYFHFVVQDVALCLLEAGANVDQKNQSKQTPLFSACDGLQRNLAHVSGETQKPLITL